MKQLPRKIDKYKYIIRRYIWHREVNVTADGMTTMTQVVAGDILMTQIRTRPTNVNKLLGGPRLQPSCAGSAFTYSLLMDTARWCHCVNASAGGIVYADNATGGSQKDPDDVQALCLFLGCKQRTGVNRCKSKHNYCGDYLVQFDVKHPRLLEC